ncbi:MAG: hypothetical protein EA341_07260 [Mongoliibacter sp.]|uniref:MauE/DoxX family redox-associated membrane protein n=1 Tax=Mongoliibacter sp. TaxID=2022438 RepID=UPI0012F0329B|nr:MauE/DoxX family redox-associated membrane protein [Mongoliibacter sp.]TVP50554.1 MAG: hypothetical protein EA341_07260 [Mongoliibacter sp.]
MEKQYSNTTWKSEVISLMLSLLFAYTAIAKLYDWHGTIGSLQNQVFPELFADLLLYGLPPLELGTALLLITEKYRRVGLWIALVLMIAFTLYIGVVMTGIFGRIPCSCGGVINSLSWEEHLVFNLIFLGLAVIGIKVVYSD